MAQVNENIELRPSKKILRASNLSVSVAQTGNTTLLELFTDGIEKLSVQVDNTVQALDAFIVQGKAHPDATYQTIASTAADFASPSGRILKATGALTTLAAAASGSFDMDVSGLFAVKILASGGNATASVVSIYASGTSGVIPGGVNISGWNGREYETVAASQTAQVLGATGATGDDIDGLLVIPANTSPGAVTLLDNATSIALFTGGASSVSNLVPFFIPLGMRSVSGAWKITTGASVSVIAVGNFT